MGAVRLIAPALMLVLAPPAHAENVARWHAYIDEASSRFGVPTSWIERVMRAESRGLTTLKGVPIRSHAGAMGLMQLMPATWAAMRARLGLGANPDDPRDNILAGTLYLRLMYDRFGYPGLFGAYNAGPGAYADWLAGKRRLPSETATYLGTVGGVTVPPASVTATAVPPPLFVVWRDTDTATSETDRPAGQSSLFAIRRPVP